MSEFIGSVWWLIVSLGVLVTFHEFGHYWVARRCGVDVLRFSVGFGKPLWRRIGRDGTEYAVAAIPLGGYVKMLDEREGEVPAARLGHAFNRQGVWRRIAIVAAGPLANLLLTVLLLWAMFVIGRPDYAPTIGAVDGPAAAAGLRPGDRVLSVDDTQTPTWSELGMAIAAASLDRRAIVLRVRGTDGASATRTVPATAVRAAAVDDVASPLDLGLIPTHMLVPPTVGRVEKGSPAWGVLAEGDRITSIDGQPIRSFEQIGPTLQAMESPARPLMVEVERDHARLALEVVPRRVTPADGPARWQLGIAAAPANMPPPDATLRYGPLAAVPAAFAETWKLLTDSVAMIGHMVTGRASVQNVSGPITIARYANASADLGLAWFLQFLALLSLSLAVINLLPIPILDGGHLLYYLIELAKGRPLGERAMAAGQYLGLVMLAGLMGLAFYNDIARLLS
jgi:regulator of sigma E protease